MAVTTSDDWVLRRPTVFLSLLPASRSDWRLALSAVALLSVAFLALVPFAKMPLVAMPAFIPSYQAALFVCDLITAIVLFGQFSVQRTRGLLILATAYLFTALAIVPHTLSFPGLFAPGGAIGGGPQTTVWLYMLWHGAFPLLVTVYALTKSDERKVADAGRVALLAMAAALGAVLAGTLITTTGHKLLPTLLKADNTYTTAMYLVISSVWVLNVVALVTLVLRPPYRALDLWMMVVMVAWIGDVGLSATFNAKRFDLGFYAGRACGLVAAGFVLVMLLLETRALYTRLARRLSTARDAAVEELHRSQELYRSLFELSPYAATVSDLENLRILAANDAAVAQYGWSREEMLDRDVTALIHPEEQPRVLAWRKDASRTSSLRMEGVRHRRKDGTPIEIDVVSRVIDYDGRPALLAILENVSERRKIERQSRRIFETSQDVILVTDGYGQIVQISPSCLATLGYAPEDMVGRNAIEFVYSEDLEATRQEMREARRNHTPRHFRTRYSHKNGRAVTLEWSGLWSEADRLHFFIGRDMTAIETKEEQLRQAQKMEAVGQLTGGVAHDFNNILMVIQANVEELLEDDTLSADQREMLTSIATSGERAAEMTQRLLAFSRKQRLQPQTTNLTQLVAGIDKLLRRTLGQQIEIDTVLAEDLWTASIDRSQFEAALVNLCVNARDAMPGGGKLLIETDNTWLEEDYAALNPGVVPGPYVMVSVTDTGTGISPDNLAKVFDPFFTTKEVGKGTGLGLSMVYGFIKQSEGHIKVYSEEGRGTTIRMYLPRSGASMETDEERSAALPRGSERVLLVEDEPHVRTAVLRQLRALGYSVSDANGGQAALALLETERFDLMLTDIIMPGIDGAGLTRIAAVKWPDMKILFMSGYSERGVKSFGVVDGESRVLSKPFRKIELATRVREALDG